MDSSFTARAWCQPHGLFYFTAASLETSLSFTRYERVISLWIDVVLGMATATESIFSGLVYLGECPMNTIEQISSEKAHWYDQVCLPPELVLVYGFQLSVLPLSQWRGLGELCPHIMYHLSHTSYVLQFSSVPVPCLHHPFTELVSTRWSTCYMVSLPLALVTLINTPCIDWASILWVLL